MEEVALEEGLDALSMRTVAKRVGISLAALQYHFPSKEVLISAFVRSKLEFYRKEIDAICHVSERTSELRDVILYAINHTFDARTDDIFSMLKARSRHDPMTALAMESFMGFYLAIFRDLILRRQPNIPLQSAMLAAAKVVAMIEGMSSVQSAASTVGLSKDDLREAVLATADALSPIQRRT